MIGRSLSVLALSTSLPVLTACAREGAPPAVVLAPPTSPPSPSRTAPADTATAPGDASATMKGAAKRVRVEAVADDPAAFVGQLLDCEIVDPLDGPATEKARLEGTYVSYRVHIADRNQAAIDLVAPGFDVHDHDRYKRKLDRVLTPPLVVHGRLVADPDPDLSPPQYALIVERAAPMELEPPVRVASYEELGTDGHLDRKVVAVSGMFEHGLETSRIGPMWVSHGRFAPGALKPSPVPNTTVGLLLAKPGARYGHLGVYKYELVLPGPE